MLICATLFWAGNFMVGKFAFMTNIPPMTLVFSLAIIPETIFPDIGPNVHPK